MSALALKSLLGIGSLAACPLGVAYILTADHSTIPLKTLASSNIENRFKIFDDRAQDSLPVAERRHRGQKIREGLAVGGVV
ncbi:uncharacterized protein MYCFIDRAFT_204084 [Pseudocercospora fijiensis CIRAD86]|uniref:Uncharacterized protein n=1 Tax=Pseudocercospora fijiensis (strain CIRAD86) TaxID=383855 RepID=M2ZNZ7_PSEFD|nr:uncharacterized protein MYCFIDRAFT_204084 [Pseudocercospora fijiensis CIRAD86]EME80809.1 hypothetical protein MYCFIDRAFT_204084 [Pseudocercospora fijiensis CIRAD86]